MRITDGMRHTATQQAHAAANQRVATATEQAVTGKRVSAPKDDPGAFARATRGTAAMERWSAREQALSLAEGDARIAESALASSADIMTRLREIAVQMADGLHTASDRADSAKEVTALRQQLVEIANSRGQSGYLFGGTATAAPPFDSAGVFSGNDNPAFVETSDGATVRRNASGAQAFTAAGGRDIFADIAALASALTANDVAAVQSSIDAIDQGHEQVVRARAESGLVMDRVATAQAIAEEVGLQLSKAVVDDIEVDAMSSYTELASAQAAYERSIEVARRVMSMFDIKAM